MRRPRLRGSKPLAALCALALAAALVSSGCSGGWGAVGRSVADRLLPYPEVSMWAPTPAPDAFADSYDDATGAGRNYVYLVDASDEDGNVRELQLICFGEKFDGEGWLEIEAKGGSGVRYLPVEQGAVPKDAASALDRG